MKINGDVLGRRRRRRKGTYENKQTTHTKIKREKERKRTKTKCIPLFWLVSFLLRFHQLVRRGETIHKMKKKRKSRQTFHFGLSQRLSTFLQGNRRRRRRP
jgi:hypothetical protein